MIAKENGDKPYIYTGSMTFPRINQIFAQHQFDPVTRMNIHNYKTLCGQGVRGEGPCIVYLYDSSVDSVADLNRAKAAMRCDVSCPLDTSTLNPKPQSLILTPCSTAVLQYSSLILTSCSTGAKPNPLNPETRILHDGHPRRHEQRSTLTPKPFVLQHRHHRRHEQRHAERA